MTQACQLCSRRLASLHSLRGQVLATVAIIAAEFEKPTMNRLDLLKQVRGRLEGAADISGG